MTRVSFYFDGFNFYNGLKSQSKKEPIWRKYYWMDIVKFCTGFLGVDQKLEAVKYFTADPISIQQRKRHKTFFDVNRALNPAVFEIVQGKYYKKGISCLNCHTVFEHPEEKRTDVNLSVHLMADCAMDKSDVFVLVSADSDMIPIIQGIKKHFPTKKIKVYFPPSRS